MHSQKLRSTLSLGLHRQKNAFSETLQHSISRVTQAEQMHSQKLCSTLSLGLHRQNNAFSETLQHSISRVTQAEHCILRNSATPHL